jgi:hypothetical protein
MLLIVVAGWHEEFQWSMWLPFIRFSSWQRRWSFIWEALTVQVQQYTVQCESASSCIITGGVGAWVGRKSAASLWNWQIHQHFVANSVRPLLSIEQFCYVSRWMCYLGCWAINISECLLINQPVCATLHVCCIGHSDDQALGPFVTKIVRQLSGQAGPDPFQAIYSQQIMGAHAHSR